MYKNKIFVKLHLLNCNDMSTCPKQKQKKKRTKKHDQL